MNLSNLRTVTRARGVHKPGVMNGTERRYSEHLNAQKLVGIVQLWEFEKLTLKIGPDCRLTPDFCVLMADGAIVLDDVKGTKRDKSTGKQGYYAEGDAMVKIRTAAQQFPWLTFRICWFTSEGWQTKEIA